MIHLNAHIHILWTYWRENCYLKNSFIKPAISWKREEAESQIWKQSSNNGDEGGVCLILTWCERAKNNQKSIVCQKLCMEELPYLKEKQALKFKEKFFWSYFWSAYSTRNQFRDLVYRLGITYYSVCPQSRAQARFLFPSEPYSSSMLSSTTNAATSSCTRTCTSTGRRPPDRITT